MASKPEEKKAVKQLTKEEAQALAYKPQDKLTADERAAMDAYVQRFNEEIQRVCRSYGLAHQAYPTAGLRVVFIQEQAGGVSAV